jgi:dipeptidyl aminopeptidase/acylaminoacyl peptidase
MLIFTISPSTHTSERSMIICYKTVISLFAMIEIVGSTLCLASDRRPFSVRDSIEMTMFSDPYTRSPEAQCKRSPDGKYFLIVTTQGVLKTNQLVSTLWIYSAVAVDRYLYQERGRSPFPEPLFKVSETPVARQNNSYGSLITKAQWSRDSRSVLSLVEQPNGYHHLFRTILSGKESIDLTPGRIDLTDFSESGGTIAYLVQEHIAPPKTIGVPINEASSDLTRLSLFHILFTHEFPESSSLYPPVDLWVLYKGAKRRVNTGAKWYFPPSAASLRVSVSPDGRRLIAARPVSNVPATWLDYKVPSNTFTFSSARTNQDRSGRSATWPWEYIRIDLDTMNIVSLAAAPSGFLAGYIDTPQAVWSPDGNSVLFTNSYLPLSTPTNMQNTSACAAVIYNVAKQTSTCIVYAKFPKTDEALRVAEFVGSSKEVLLHWSSQKSQEKNECYRETDWVWALEACKNVKDESDPKLRISIRQDIDVRPALWASKSGTSLQKLLWDPNPQFDSLELGQASVYTWKDNTGYEWHAGLVLPRHFIRGNRYPLVIQNHGFYNEHEFLVDGSFTTGFAAQPLAAAGVVVLQIGDRTDRHTGPAQDEAALEALGFESAIDQLAEDGVVDPARVGIIGFSRTAWYVEEALIRAPDRFRAATLIDGTDQSYMTYMLFGPEWPQLTNEIEAANGGKPFGNRLQHWLQTAANFNLDKVQSPIRIETHGQLSILGEWETYSSLYLQGKPVDLIDIPKGQHILQAPQERYASQQGDVDWFRFWLEGYEDPDPIKRSEYQRWNEWKLGYKGQ